MEIFQIQFHHKKSLKYIVIYTYTNQKKTNHTKTHYIPTKPKEFSEIFNFLIVNLFFKLLLYKKIEQNYQENLRSYTKIQDKQKILVDSFNYL